MKSNKFIEKIKRHPTNKELSDFIDNKLFSIKREKIIEHLIYCDDCSDKVAIVIKSIKKK